MSAKGIKTGLLLLAEECGELTQAAIRFALKKTRRRVNLTDEAAQVVALIDALIKQGVIDKVRFDVIYRSEHKDYMEKLNG
jgi:NTP pyrophosphatase (non-canonical NTP hydrolase)